MESPSNVKNPGRKNVHLSKYVRKYIDNKKHVNGKYVEKQTLMIT